MTLPGKIVGIQHMWDLCLWLAETPYLRISFWDLTKSHFSTFASPLTSAESKSNAYLPYKVTDQG